MNTQVYLSQILRSCEVESLQRRANELEKRLIPHMEGEIKYRNDYGLSILADTYVLMSLKREYTFCIERIRELNGQQTKPINSQEEHQSLKLSQDKDLAMVRDKTADTYSPFELRPVSSQDESPQKSHLNPVDSPTYPNATYHSEVQE